MKRYIHEANAVKSMLSKINNAKRKLEQFDKDKVDFVTKCHDEVNKELSKRYSDDELDNEAISVTTISGIKTDYLIEAIEDDIMTEEEFNEIFRLLDILDMDNSYQ